MTRLPALVAAGVVAAAPALAVAAASVELAKARAAYQRSEYAKAIDLLGPVLADARQVADLSDDEQVEARKILGLSWFYLAQQAPADDRPAMLERAGAELAALLFLDPEYVIDSALEGVEAATFFEQVRRDQAAKLDEIRRQRELDEERRKRPRNERVILRVTHDPAGWKNFVPFGYAQFKNGQPKKAALLGVLQGAGFATSAYFYLQHSVKYGWPTGTLPADPDEVDTIQFEQYVQIGAGILFFAAYAYSVYDGFENQRPAVSETVEIRPIVYPDEQPPAAPEAPAEKKSPKRESRFRIVPQGSGLGLTWEL